MATFTLPPPPPGSDLRQPLWRDWFLKLSQAFTTLPQTGIIMAFAARHG